MYNPSRRYSHERPGGGYASPTGHVRRKIITKPKHIIHSMISDKIQMCKPVAVAVSPQDGKIIVADQELNQLLLFDRKYKFIKAIGKSGSGECEFYHIKSVNFSTKGEVVVADTGNHRIQVLTPSCEFIREFGQRGKGVGEFSDMTDIVVDTQNRIYVCDCGNNRVQVLDLTGRFIREFGCCGSKIGDVDHPQGITVCPSTGSVILADTNNKRVQVFYATGQHRLTVGWMGSEEGELMEPLSVAIGAHWTILVADPTQGRICVFKNDGILVMEIGHCGQLDNGEQFEPRHIATNRDNGDVVVVDGLNKRIIVFQIDLSKL